MTRAPSSILASSILMIGVALSGRSAFALVTVSTGYTTPETLTELSDGSYLVVDAAGQNFRMPSQSSGFGAPSVFSSNPLNVTSVAGMLLPTSFGTNGSGQPLFGTFGSVGGTTGVVYTYDSSDASHNASQTVLASTAGSFAQAVAVPSFGAYSGDVLLADQRSGDIAALTPAGVLSVVATVPFVAITSSTHQGSPFGLTQAPATFGAFSNDVLFGEAFAGTIDALTPDGVIHPFATIPLLTGQTGLRQISILPAGFLPGQTTADLLVAVSGSKNGGGTMGALVVLDPNGTIVSYLNLGGLTAFDPRGTAFSDSGNLLITNAANGTILMAQPADFIAGGSADVPEPATLALLAIGAAALFTRPRR